MVSALRTFYRDNRLTLVLITGLIIGRLTGLLREFALLGSLGIGRESDIAIAALTIPDLFADFILVAGFSAVLIPYFNQQKSEQLVSSLVSTLLVFFGLSVMIAFSLAWHGDLVLEVLIPGLLPLTTSESRLIHGAFILIPLCIVSGVSLAFLNARKVYEWNGMTTSILNIALIFGFGVAAFVDATNLYDLLLGTLVIAFSLRAFALVPCLVGNVKLLQSAPFRIFSVDEVPILKVMLVASSMAVINVFPVLVRSIGSLQQEGAVALYSVCIKLIQMPLAIILASMGLVAIQDFSAKYSMLEDHQASKYLTRKVMVSFCVGLVLMLFYLIFMPVIMPIIFASMNIEGEWLVLALEFIFNAALGFPIMAITLILLSDAYARQDYVSPVVTALVLAVAVYSIPAERVVHLDVSIIWTGAFCCLCAFLIVRRFRLQRSVLVYGFEIAACIAMAIALVPLAQFLSSY